MADESTPTGEPGRELEHRQVRHEVIVPLPLEETRAQMAVYQEGLHGLLAEEDWQDTGSDGRFLKKSGWRKIATWLNLSIEIRDDNIERGPDGQVQRAKVIVRAVAPSGRYADGDGYCDVAESRFNRNKSKLENDLRGTATTRATNRAISNLVGLGAVSGEEVDDAPLPNTGPPFGPVQEKVGGLRAATAYLLSPAGEIAADDPRVDGVLASLVQTLEYLPKAAAIAVVTVAKAHREIHNPQAAAAPPAEPAAEEPVDAEVVEEPAEDLGPPSGSIPTPPMQPDEQPTAYLARLKGAGCICSDPLGLTHERPVLDPACPLTDHGVPF